MAAFEPVPPRFRQAHDQMRGALSSFESHMELIRLVNTQPQLDAWFDIWDLRAFEVNLAYDDYLLVVGLSLPSLPN